MPSIEIDVAVLADRLTGYTPGPDDAPMPPWWELLQWIRLHHIPIPWPPPPDPDPPYFDPGRDAVVRTIAALAHGAVQQAAALHLAGADGAALLRQLVDDYCGTPPRRPWPWPPHVPWTGEVRPAEQFALGVSLAQAARRIDGSPMAAVALDAAAAAMTAGLRVA